MAFTTRGDILKKVGENDDAGWREFVEYYTPLIRLRAKDLGLSPQETEELCQDVFVRIFRSGTVNRFDRGKGKFRTLLRAIISNAAIDLIRARRNTVEMPSAEEPLTDDDAMFEEEWRQFLYEKALAEVRGGCDPATFMAFEFYALRGLPVQQVVQMTSLSEDSVYQAKTRILRRLKEVVNRLQRELAE